MKSPRAVRLVGPVVLAGALAVVGALPTPAAALEQKLTVADGAADDFLGSSVAIDGDTAVVGASDDGNFRGAVYVFTRSGDSWTQTARLTAADGATGDFLGDSVAIDGDAIVAGAPGDDVGANQTQGSAYTFARTGAAQRTQTAKLTASDGAAGDQLGISSVAIDGDAIVAGAAGDDVGVNADQGSAYTFARTGGAQRTQTAKLTAVDGAAGDFLGLSVAIDGDAIVAGAAGDDAGVSAAQGSAYTFARTGDSQRTQTAKLTAADGAAGDLLGASVAIDGETIVTGANGDDVGANQDQGSAYTFSRRGAALRTQTARLTAADGAAGDSLGASVAIDGDAIVAGAPWDDVDANENQGSAYTFARTGAAQRTQTARLTAADGAAGDELGRSVAIDGETILAGAPLDDVGANATQGSASIFFAASPGGGPPPSGDGAPPPPGPGPGPAAPRAGRVLELDASRGAVRRGRAVQLRGKIEATSNPGACQAGQPVEVQRRTASNSTFVTFARVVSDQTGNFAMTIRPTGTAEYRTLVHETDACLAEASNDETVAVPPVVSVVARSTKLVGRTVRFQLRCPRGGECVGTVKLRTAGKVGRRGSGRRMTLGAKAFQVPAKRRRTTQITVSRRIARALRTRSRVRLNAFIANRDQQGRAAFSRDRFTLRTR